MTAELVPLVIEQGATYFMSFVWSEDSLTTPGTPGDPIPNTGATARMQIRKTQQSAVLVDALSTGTDPMILLGGDDGRITIKIPGEATNLLTSKTCLYDFEMVMVNGDIYRLVEGAVTVKPNITQLTGVDPVVR